MQAGVASKQWVASEAIFRAMTEKYGHANVVTRQSTLHFVQVGCCSLSYSVVAVAVVVVVAAVVTFGRYCNL